MFKRGLVVEVGGVYAYDLPALSYDLPVLLII